MDEPEDDVPYVILEEDETPPPPPRRRPWLWAGTAGTLVLAALGGLALYYGRRPSTPPPTFAGIMPFAPEDSAPLEAPLVVVEPVHELPPAAPAPVPTPKPAPVPPEVEVPVIVEEPTPVVEEKPPEPVKPVAKIPVPAPAPPPAKEPPPLELELDIAAAAIGDATPLFNDLADHFDPPAFQKGDVRELAAKMDLVEAKLKDAQGIYTRLNERAPDEILERRLESIRDLLDSLKEGRARIRVPLALKRAEVFQQEAAPLAKESLEGFQPYSREAQALDVRAEVAAGKLREARRLYVSIRNDVPDPERVDQRVKNIDAQLEAIEGRYPQTRTAQ